VSASTSVTISIDFLELAGAVGGLISVLAGLVYLFGRLLIRQFNQALSDRFVIRDQNLAGLSQRLDEKFDSRDQVLEQLTMRLDARFSASEQSMESFRDNLARVQQHVTSVERDHLRLQVSLPNEYVRREDWIRFSGTIDTKLDWLRQRFEETGKLITKLMERAKPAEASDGA
jgi:hypothetical protein